MPGFHHAMAGTLRGDGQAIDLARESDGEVADVDHFLHFAKPLGNDLARLQSHHRPQILLGGAQLLAEQPYKFTPAGRRNLAPGQKSVASASEDRRHFGQRRLRNAGNLNTVDRRADSKRSGPKRLAVQSRACESLTAGHWFSLVRKARRGPARCDVDRKMHAGRQGLLGLAGRLSKRRTSTPAAIWPVALCTHFAALSTEML